VKKLFSILLLVGVIATFGLNAKSAYADFGGFSYYPAYSDGTQVQMYGTYNYYQYAPGYIAWGSGPTCTPGYPAGQTGWSSTVSSSHTSLTNPSRVRFSCNVTFYHNGSTVANHRPYVDAYTNGSYIGHP
jgi:hypothetical protein